MKLTITKPSSPTPFVVDVEFPLYSATAYGFREEVRALMADGQGYKIKIGQEWNGGIKYEFSVARFDLGLTESFREFVPDIFDHAHQADLRSRFNDLMGRLERSMADSHDAMYPKVEA